ncbi:hypothetical protein EJB05_37977, partial [Eragrostis curvula]
MELQVGWVYGSVTEDILTGQRIHSAGWRSTLLDIEPVAFLGSVPTEAPACLIQYKRWTTGLFEILLSKNNLILPSIFKHLEFRQCLAYLVVYIWPVRAPFELCYALLGPYCLLANQSFLPKALEPGFSIAFSMFLMYNIVQLHGVRGMPGLRPRLVEQPHDAACLLILLLDTRVPHRAPQDPGPPGYGVRAHPQGLERRRQHRRRRSRAVHLRRVVGVHPAYGAHDLEHGSGRCRSVERGGRCSRKAVRAPESSCAVGGFFYVSGRLSEDLWAREATVYRGASS